jgi:hypothetical protein
MSHILLLGAGFSRNWGGWLASEAFEYLLGCPEVIGDDVIKDALWRHKTAGGFEDALAQIQGEGDAGRIARFESALSRMFADMDRAFAGLPKFEFRDEIQRTVGVFLTKFDAIFTLNQDCWPNATI